jgi:hypothetical protein
MSPTRRCFLAGTAALGVAAALGLPAAVARANPSRRLVLVFASGGWDVTCALDPKPGRPDIDGPELDEDPTDPDDREAIATLGGIPILENRVKRPAVSRFFERWGGRTAVLNGVWVGSIAHSSCTVRMMTGTRTSTHPDLAAITGATVGEARPIPYMDLSGVGYTGALAAFAGRTGARNQLKLLLDRSVPIPGPTGSEIVYPTFRPSPDDRSALDAFLDARADRFSTRGGGHAPSEAQVADLLEARERARALQDAGDGFADSLEFGRVSDLASMAPTIRQLLSSGLCHTISVDAGPRFDTHDDNAEQHPAWEATFAGLDRLMAELRDGDLLDDTVVLVVSEMTRTPRRNQAGGKDHWPLTSALVMGAGVAGGRVLGGTDDRLDALPVDLATGVLDPNGVVPRYDNLAAGILELCGADPGRWVPGVEAYRGFFA